MWPATKWHALMKERKEEGMCVRERSKPGQMTQNATIISSLGRALAILLEYNLWNKASSALFWEGECAISCSPGYVGSPLCLSLQGCHCVIHNSVLTAHEGEVNRGIFFHVTESNRDQGFSTEALITLVSLTKNKFYFSQGSWYFIGTQWMCKEGFAIYPWV